MVNKTLRIFCLQMTRAPARGSRAGGQGRHGRGTGRGYSSPYSGPRRQEVGVTGTGRGTRYAPDPARHPGIDRGRGRARVVGLSHDPFHTPHSDGFDAFHFGGSTSTPSPDM